MEVTGTEGVEAPKDRIGNQKKGPAGAQEIA